jgi:hypothetical protein
MPSVQRTDVGFRQVGTFASVPDNDIARCMYYLKCVCSVIDCGNENILRYTTYQNYSRLSVDEHEVVYKLCLLLSPDEFEDKLFFDNDALCGSSGNEFYEISQVQHVVRAVGSIVIAGQRRQATSIMAYKMSWMRANYLGPMSRLADRFNPQRRLLRALNDNDCTIS